MFDWFVSVLRTELTQSNIVKQVFDWFHPVRLCFDNTVEPKQHCCSTCFQLCSTVFDLIRLCLSVFDFVHLYSSVFQTSRTKQIVAILEQCQTVLDCVQLHSGSTEGILIFDKITLYIVI